jgi:predicted nucleotide-binding protein
LQKLLDQIPDVRAKGPRSAELSTWEKNAKIILADFYGEQSRTFREFNGISFGPGQYYPGQPQSDFTKALTSGLDKATGFLQSRVGDLAEQIKGAQPAAEPFAARAVEVTRNVFLVHGHDLGTAETIARFLEKLELNAIVLREKPDEGRTIIEKFEAHSDDVHCAVVILTADDTGSSRATPEQTEFRARQNVILELGFFVGKLGRNRTFALVQEGVTLPSDFHGVIYIPLDDGGWRLRLVRELKAAGLEVDANKAFE